MRYYQKFLLILFFAASFFIFPSHQFAAEKPNLPSITVINLIRGNELGHEKDDLYKSLQAQWQVTKEASVNATWLFQYSTLEKNDMVSFAKKEMSHQEFGLLLELDRNTLTKSRIQYKGQGPWYFSDGVFLNAYDRDERRQIIDTNFEKFKSEFGYYPKTVGAWWIGADSLVYMQEKYGITAALKAADQYDLDFYSIWGSPWSIPYVASKENALMPSKDIESSSKVVILQWAARDPLKGYKDPLYSIQDYTIKGYDSTYVDYMASIFLKKPTDNLVFGLENGGTLETFGTYYKGIITEGKKLESENKAQLMLVKDYADSMLSQNRVLPATHYFLSKDYASDDQSFWYNSENYRVSIEKLGEDVYLFDLFSYAEKKEEDYAVLPNTQPRLKIRGNSVVDSMSFPDSKVLIGKSKESLKITVDKNSVSLFAGDKKIADFSKDKLSYSSGIGKKEYVFTTPEKNMALPTILFIIYLSYILVAYLYRKRITNPFTHLALLLIPYFLAIQFLKNTSGFLFDKKEIIFLNFLPLHYFPPIEYALIFVKLLPFIILFITHLLFCFNYKNIRIRVLYYTVLIGTTILYLHVPYFPVERSTFKEMLILFGIVGSILFVFNVLKFRKTKFKRYLAMAFVGIPLIILVMIGVILFSRSKYIITPFEIRALEYIKSQKKDVLAVEQQVGQKPIYKEIRPLLLGNYKIAEKLTGKKWDIVMRPEDNVLKVTGYEKKVFFVPRYIGSDLSPYEMEHLKLRNVFDNGQIDIFEK